MKVFCFGVGWLGSLVKEQCEREEISFSGTTTSGKTDHISWEIGCEIPELIDVSNVLIAIPASRWSLENLENFLKELSMKFKGHLTWVSSIGVYPTKGQFTESTDLTPYVLSAKNELLLMQEYLVSKYFPKACLIRLGGLFGYQRHPARHFVNNRIISEGQAPANMIHGDDAAGITMSCLKKRITGLINGVPPIIPTRELFYSKAFEKLKLGIPNIDDGKVGRMIVSERINKELAYNWKFDNPILAYELEY